MTLADMLAATFAQARVLCGNPVLTAIGPIAGWHLPAGWAYDAGADAITNAFGQTMTDAQCAAYWTTSTVNCVPAEQASNLLVLTPGGLAPDGGAAVIILSADIAAVKAAWAVILNGDHYNVTDVQTLPAGASPALATVQLHRRS